MTDSLFAFLDLLNETLASAIVIVAFSMLLYNLTRNIKNRVTRTSSAVLGCVTVVYVCDVLISLGPGVGTYEALLRLQWLGLAFIPAAMFHLSDALLATTGLPSRGRRRRVVRLLYAISTLFLVLATFTDLLIEPLTLGSRVSLRAGVLFPVYIAYFLLNNIIAFINVERARRRCLTRTTQRRMTYLLVAMITPVVGIFPYSVLLGPGQEYTLSALTLVNLGNLIIIFMLVFLAYPLSFFGSRVPDRVVKAELLRFMLRGPGTGLIALVTIVFIDPTARLFGWPGETFMPFATIALILLYQWMIDLAIPRLEKALIYRSDDDTMEKVQRLSERFLSRSDLVQLIEAVLEGTCDYLRVNAAFVVSLNTEGSPPELVKAIGHPQFTGTWPNMDELPLLPSARPTSIPQVHPWQNFWLIPLYSQRNAVATNRPVIGIMGIEARSETTASEETLFNEDEQGMLRTFVRRAAQALDDLLLQSEISAALEGLLPQMALTRNRAAEVEFRPGRTPAPQANGAFDRQQVIEQVHAALRHYWGGPGLSQSRLLELNIVQEALSHNDNSAVKALRDVLNQAIERLRPPGERDMKSQEWMLYNILQLRFLEKRKARETAQRLYMAEASLYRKQNIAIEAVADAILAMEHDSQP
ncbi:MAG: histidine kinase N-terminal 7TM domain-containing protein [bacterium]|nr:histidine kinase N-terminal 7TM domain-containing protein [bacterium]